MQNEVRLRVAVNGYGVIGKCVADTMEIQPGMKIARIAVAAQRGSLAALLAVNIAKINGATVVRTKKSACFKVVLLLCRSAGSTTGAHVLMMEQFATNLGSSF